MQELGIEQVIAVGELARAYGGDWVATAAEAADAARGDAAAGGHRAREGIPLGGTRGRRGEPVRVMARVLVAALIAMVIAILAGPWFISFLRRNEFGQHVREEGPQNHVVKQGTPTMGGLLIVAAASIAFLAVSDRTVPALTIFGTRSRAGRSGSWTTSPSCATAARSGSPAAGRCCSCSAITVAVGFAAHHQQLGHSVFIPVIDRYSRSVPAGTSSCS